MNRSQNSVPRIRKIRFGYGTVLGTAPSIHDNLSFDVILPAKSKYKWIVLNRLYRMKWNSLSIERFYWRNAYGIDKILKWRSVPHTVYGMCVKTDIITIQIQFFYRHSQLEFIQPRCTRICYCILDQIAQFTISWDYDRIKLGLNDWEFKVHVH